MFKLALIAALMTVGSCRPQGQDGLSTILRSNNEADGLGGFSYGYETSNGITANANGYIRNPQARDEDQIQVIEGSYSYYTPEGQLIQVSYIADELGYRITSQPIRTNQPVQRPFGGRPNNVPFRRQ